jgi:hypothetical protein
MPRPLAEMITRWNEYGEGAALSDLRGKEPSKLISEQVLSRGFKTSYQVNV